MKQNRQWCINGNPHGRAIHLSDFKLNSAALPELGPEEIRVQVDYLEFTPSLKGQMENRLAYAEKTKQGQVMRGRGLGTVIESRSADIATGAKVHGYLGWQEYTTLPAADVKQRADDDMLRYHLGPLGSTGMAAYFGFFDAGEPKAGDVVLISGAAGGVGSMVGQMAKLSRCTVIGGKKMSALIGNHASRRSHRL